MTKGNRFIALFILAIILTGFSFACSGCADNPADPPIQKTTAGDNVPSYNTGLQVSVTDYYNVTTTYEYSKIWYAEGILNIEFPECSEAKYLNDKFLRPDGCGVAIPQEYVKTYTTL